VLVDVDMIRRVLINLLENAIKFTPSQGKIFLQICQQDAFILISIKDSGPGIPLADQERIFEKFTRLPIKEGPKGLGLGLAFCRLAVTGHGGRIWVESQPGQGADFRFLLPIAEETEAD
jgi:signal transduction histidine kinase